MIYFLAGAFGFLGALFAHDVAAQTLSEQPLRPFAGSCPRCGTTRGWLRVRCPECGRTIGRELLLAIVGTLGALAFANTVGSSWVLLAYLAFLVLSLALVITDLDAMRIVDRLNLRGTLVLAILLGVTAFAEGLTGGFWRSLLGAGAYFLGTNLMFVMVRGRGFGYGDVKLSVQLGLFTVFVSWGTLGWSVLLTALIGGVLSIGVIVLAAVRSRTMARTTGESGPRMREMMQTELPYGPAMVAGCWLAIFLAGIGAFPIPT